MLSRVLKACICVNIRSDTYLFVGSIRTTRSKDHWLQYALDIQHLKRKQLYILSHGIIPSSGWTALRMLATWMIEVFNLIEILSNIKLIEIFNIYPDFILIDILSNVNLIEILNIYPDFILTEIFILASRLWLASRIWSGECVLHFVPNDGKMF